MKYFKSTLVGIVAYQDLAAGSVDYFRLGPDSPWTVRMLFRGRTSPVLEVGALSDLDNVSVRIADVAANLAVLGNRFREELGSSTFPQFVARLNIRNAEIHKAVDVIRVGDAERHRRLIRGRPAPNVENHPDIRKLKVRRSVAVAHGQNASAEDLFVVASRSLDVGDGEKMRDADPLSRRHLKALLFDLHAAHSHLQFRQTTLSR